MRTATFLFACSVWIAHAELPAGWHTAGSDPSDYEMGTDFETVYSGRTSAFIKNKSPDARGFGTLMQSFDPGEYRGKRLRLSAYAKSEGVVQWAGLWMRVDGKQGSRPLAFDNMQNRPIKGTTEWVRYEIVLDVPSKSTLIAFGVLLRGNGKVWIDDLQFEIVGDTVPVTDLLSGDQGPRQPRNLDFEVYVQ